MKVTKRWWIAIPAITALTAGVALMVTRTREKPDQTEGIRTQESQAPENEVDVMGKPPMTALVGDGIISSGFSAEGKMVSFFYPSVGAYDAIPYHTTREENKPFYGALKHFGAFPGIAILDDTGGIKVFWADKPCYKEHDWDMPQFTYSYALVKKGSGWEFSDAECKTPPPGAVFLKFDVFAPFDPKTAISDMDSFNSRHTVTYNLRLTNASGENLKLGIAYYAFLDPSGINQQPELLVKVSSFTKPIAGWKPIGYGKVKYSGGKLFFWKESGSGRNYYMGIGSDAGSAGLVYADAAEADIPLLPPPLIFSEGIYRDFYATQNENIEGREFCRRHLVLGPCANSGAEYAMNGVMIWNLGEMGGAWSQRSMRIFLSAGDNENDVVSTLNDNAAETNDQQIENTKLYWNTFIQKGTPVGNDALSSLKDDDPAKQLLRWWIITLRLLADRQSGAIVASPALIPLYYCSWPRDGTYQALTWIALGNKTIPQKYFQYLFSIRDTYQGAWFQCYDSNTKGKEYAGLALPLPDGPVELRDKLVWLYSIQEFGVYNKKVMEEDQLPLVMIGMWYYWRKFGQLPMGEEEGKKEVRRLAEYIRNNAIIKGDGETVRDYLGLKFRIKNGLVRPSSDSYEFPGEISADFSKLPDITTNPRLIASRQSSYVNLAAVSALLAASEMLNDPNNSSLKSTIADYQTAACSLRKKTEELFFKDGHFYTAWSNILKNDNKNPYDRQEDLSTAIAYPIQAYSFDDPRIKQHALTVIQEYETSSLKETLSFKNGRIFVPSYLLTEIYKLIGKPEEPKRQDLGLRNTASDPNSGLSGSAKEEKTGDLNESVTLLKFNKIPIDQANHYLPESVDTHYNRLVAIEPLGWSHALGIMYLLMQAKDKFTPPAMTIPCDVTPGDNNYIFVLDVSGSMNDNNKLNEVKKAVPPIVEDLQAPGTDNRYAMLTYSCGLGVDTPIVVPFTNDANSVLESVKGLTAGGSTPMVSGLQAAYNYAAQLPPDARGLIILLSDGQQNCPTGDVPALDHIVRTDLDLQSSKRLISNFPLSVIGYGLGEDPKLKNTLGSLARQGGGEFFDAKDPRSIKGYFRELMLKKSMPEEKAATAAVYIGAFLAVFLIALLL